MVHRGFAGGSAGKEPICQRRRYKSCGFDHWARKTPWRRALLGEKVREKMLEVIHGPGTPDVRERRLAGMNEYRYLREKLYPQLRSVRFDFYLHRAGMVKDTVHTTEPDTVYMSGLKALMNMDYKTAVTILRPYDDYNSALAFMSADYNHSALEVLGRLDDSDPKVCYLKALVLSRLGQTDEAMKYF